MPFGALACRGWTDLTSIFGVDASLLRTPTQSINPVAFAIRPDDEVSVQQYQRAVARFWTVSTIADRSIRLEHAPAGETTSAAAQELYRDAVRCMTEAAEQVTAARRERFRQAMGTRARNAALGSVVRREVLRALLMITGKVGAGKRDRLLKELRQQHALLLRDLGVDLNEIYDLLDGMFGSRVGDHDAASRAEAKQYLNERRAE